MCHFTNGEFWNETSAFVVGRLRDFRLSLRRPLVFFLDRGIGVMLYSVNFTPTHHGCQAANNFAISPSATILDPRLQRVYKCLADCTQMPSIPARRVFT